MTTFAGRLCLGALLAVLCAAFPRGTIAHVSFATIVGEVRDRESGTPLARVLVTVRSLAGTRIASTLSDSGGKFVALVPAAGRYRISGAAHGFLDATVEIDVAGAAPVPVVLLLRGAGGIGEIGAVVSRASADADASPTRRLAPAAMAEANPLRTSDALASLAGVTVSGDPGSPGGDAYVSLRGLRPSESGTLLDGHPIGPLGVAADTPDADGTVAGFNYQDAPYFALRDVVVTSGLQPGGSVPAGALGGSVDLRTLEPSARDEFVASQGFGSDGRALTSLRATGTAGPFGYALVDGVVGTHGLFSGTPVAQTGLRGTDLTSASLAASTYPVSGDYVLRNELAKIVYAPASGPRFTLTAYDATSWADKTGEGDNDFIPYAYVLANAPAGASPGCPRGVLVRVDGGTACISPSAYAAAASGPAGGGPGAWQALRNQDLDGRLTLLIGSSTLGIDAFSDAYGEVYHREASAIGGPLDAFLDRWATQGLRVSDESTGSRNAFGVNGSWLRQTLSGNGTTPDGSASVDQVPVTRIDARLDAHDAYAFSRRLTLMIGASLSKSSLDRQERFDPQATLSYRPSSRDTIRFEAGRSSEEPSLESSRLDLLPAGALNPDCGAIAQADSSAPVPVNVGSGPAPNVSAETASDLELAYERRFGSDATLKLTLYDTNIENRIVNGDFPAGGQLSASEVAPILARIAQFCGRTPAPGSIVLTLGRSFNVATARLRGLELAGRARLSGRVAVDYGYDVQSAVLDDLPAAALATNPTLVNGLQEFGIPLHEATVSLDVLLRRELEFRLAGHAVGPNNPLQLPGYAYADASLESAVARHASLTLAVSNVFGSHVQTYGLVGEGLAYPTNANGAAFATPFTEPFNERYGLAPAALTLTATLHL
jgi:hypothetical protein